MEVKFNQGQRTTQAQRLTPCARETIRLLAKSLPELRAEIAAEISRNPAIEDVDHPLERQMSEIERENRRQEREEVPDYPTEDFTPDLSKDETAAERRQAFFDNQVKEETLQSHLSAQIELSEIPAADRPLAEVLIGELNDDGYFRGTMPDIEMAFGCTEEHVRGVLAVIRTFDPAGCGACDVRECLLAQLDSVKDLRLRGIVRRMADGQLDNIAAGRFGTVMGELGIDRDTYREALKALRTLDGRPGRQYPSERERIEYVNPEIHAVKVDGRWEAFMDKRSVPAIRISKKFENLLKDPSQTAETREYVRERIAAANTFRDAIVRRQETVQAVADGIFSRQQDFFESGFAALRPMTETEIAKEVKVDPATVSRTVRDKYASTPKGTVELRRFFTSGVKTVSGEVLSQQAALDALKRVVDGEDKSAPLSDGAIVEKMKAAGFPIARRTVAKYRDKLSIPNAPQRRVGS